MNKIKLGTLKGWWIFKAKVYLVDGELKYSRAIPDGQDVAAMTYGKLWWVSVRVEKKYQAHPLKFNRILHHEHRHVMDLSHPLRFNRKRSRLEKDAREHEDKMFGKPVPWVTS